MLQITRTMLSLGERGLTLGDDIILAEFDGAGHLDIAANQKRIDDVMAAAYGRSMPDWFMPRLASAAKSWNGGQVSLAAIKLVQMGLRDPTGDPGYAQRMAKIEKYNPNHVPAGNPDGGQFTSANYVPSVSATIDRTGDDGNYSVVRTRPTDAVEYTAGDGTTFYAPPDADFSEMYSYGESLEGDPVPLLLLRIDQACGQGGIYDFQRSNKSLYVKYENASNYGVGVLLNGAGLSWEQTEAFGQAYADAKSSQSHSQTRIDWWQRGWNDAQSGKWKAK
jgi:hypothetical protein